MTHVEKTQTTQTQVTQAQATPPLVGVAAAGRSSRRSVVYQAVARTALSPVNDRDRPHPRVCSDEDWANACIETVEEVGLRSFWHGFATLLQAGHAYLYHPDHEGFPPLATPKAPLTSLKLPLPNAATQVGDLGFNTERWTAEMVHGMMVNPVYVGIPPFAPLIPLPTWVGASVNMTGELGLPQHLANVLFTLRRTFGCPASPTRYIPYGYQNLEDFEDED